MFATERGGIPAEGDCISKPDVIRREPGRFIKMEGMGGGGGGWGEGEGGGGGGRRFVIPRKNQRRIIFV
ncbi:MAG: hypothetical protein MPW15_27330 [Candidatus Manganitrophus sp.]|nr:hypothetical protein [Candidatus Manganitrophus sp.]